MTEQKPKKHFPLPTNTSAFICANCGAVALYAGSVCRPQGKGLKSDWCGIKHVTPPQFCHNKVNNVRHKCNNCGQVSINPELLCEPEKMEMSE
jgi:predicted RNA-binding Zn-ribbon protein involved in translation (DUF1610 family)